MFQHGTPKFQKMELHFGTPFWKNQKSKKTNIKRNAFKQKRQRGREAEKQRGREAEGPERT
jgi:hypothetical protein